MKLSFNWFVGTEEVLAHGMMLNVRSIKISARF